MPLFPHPIQIVVFDLGGVVVRICSSFEQAAARAGVPFDPDLVLVPERVQERKAAHALYEQGKLACDDFFALIAKTSGGLYTPEQFRRVHESWIIEEYPGIHELIDDLHAAGLHTGALSNTNAAHWAQMSRTGPFPAPSRLKHPHASHIIQHAKPDAAIYRAFERASGFPAPAIVFFDDLQANIDAARSVDWHAHRIDPTGDPAAQVRRILHAEHAIRLPAAISPAPPR